MDNPIRRSAAAVSDELLDALEEHLGTPLPAEYRAFLAAHNGGVPARTEFAYTNNKGRSRTGRLVWLFPLGRDGLVDAGALDLVAAHALRPVGLPAGLLPVGEVDNDTTLGTLCIQCAGDEAGAVFFRPEVEPMKETVFRVANSWAAFLAGMTHEGGKPPRAWKVAIRAGDVADLRTILARNERWREDVSIQTDIADEAVEEGHWPIVEYLLSTEVFEADDLFRRALRTNRLGLVGRFLDAGLVEGADDLLEELSAAGWHDADLVRRLIALGADVNLREKDGTTPLHKAVTARAADAVRVLLEAGADPTVVGEGGRTPLRLAQRLEELGLMEILRQGEAAWQARPPAPDVGATPFDLAGVTFAESGPALTLEAIQAFEAEIGFKLTPEYRWLLLQHNGGRPTPNVLPASALPSMDDDEDEHEEDDEDGDEAGGRTDYDIKLRFFPLRARAAGEAAEAAEDVDIEDEENWFRDYSVEEARGWYHDGSEIPRGMVPIASLAGYGIEGTGFVLLGCTGRSRGKLYAFDHNEARLDFDLAGLFARLAEAGRREKMPGEVLADAIAARDLAAVRAALVACGNKVPDATRDGRFPLRMALEAGFDEAVVAMAEAGHPLNRLFPEAVGHNRIDLARKLLTLGKVSKKAIREALLGGSDVYADPDFLRTLLARGIDVSKVEPWGGTLLHGACSSGHVAGVRVLVEAGCDPNARTQDGRTPLHLAAMNTSARAVEVVRYLLSVGANWAVGTESGFTPLHDAIQAGNLEVCRALLDAGADLDATFELFVPGMSPEKMQQLAQQTAQAWEEMEKLLGGGEDPDEDEKPPHLDTSEPAGEQMAGLMEGLQAMQERLRGDLAGRVAERMEQFATGSLGRGPSARDWARTCDQRRQQMGQPGEDLLPALEAYAATIRKPAP